MKWSELFGSFNDLERALKYPKRVRKLRLYFVPQLDKEEALFTKFTNIKELYIQAAIDSEPFISETIGNLTSLRKLMILNVPFDNFPQWVFNLTNLEYLMVRGNEITYIPNGIARLTKLKILRLENCELKVLPNDIKQLDSLEALSLVDTHTGIAPDLLPGNLKKLNVTYHDKNVLKNRFPNLVIE